MKKILLLVAALMTLVMSSCLPKFSSQVYYLDYYKLGHNGKILLSESNSYSGEYDALGSILVSQKKGQEILDEQTVTKQVHDDDIYDSGTVTTTTKKYKTGKLKHATYTTALEEAVRVAEERGGDAIINLHFNVIPDKPGFRVEVSGMVIKRK